MGEFEHELDLPCWTWVLIEDQKSMSSTLRKNPKLWIFMWRCVSMPTLTIATMSAATIAVRNCLIKKNNKIMPNSF